MKYTARQRAQAQRLLTSTRWQGTHGFTGEGLERWMAMKDRYLAYLLKIVVKGEAPGQYPIRPCPRGAWANGWLTLPHISEGKWGTKAGENWTRDVRRVAVQ